MKKLIAGVAVLTLAVGTAIGWFAAKGQEDRHMSVVAVGDTTIYAAPPQKPIGTDGPRLVIKCLNLEGVEVSPDFKRARCWSSLTSEQIQAMPKDRRGNPRWFSVDDGKDVTVGDGKPGGTLDDPKLSEQPPVGDGKSDVGSGTDNPTSSKFDPLAGDGR